MKQEFKPLTKEQYHSIKVGDIIERMLGFQLPIYLIVQNVTETIIDCGWIFDRNTGIEIDELISIPVSYISKILTKEEIQTLEKEGKL